MAVACCWCGTSVDDPPPTWTRQLGERGEEWVCERCTRENLRAIEGKLDTPWW